MDLGADLGAVHHHNVHSMTIALLRSLDMTLDHAKKAWISKHLLFKEIQYLKKINK